MAAFDPRQVAPEQVRPLRRREFEKLVECGAFDDDERIELLQGQLVVMNPPGPEHAFIVNRLNRLLTRAVGDRAIVSVQNPLAASDDSVPEPDLALVAEEAGQMSHPSHAFLVVEVADTSLAKDRGIKAALYARMLIPEYWIVDLRGKVVERYLDPHEGRFRVCTQHTTGSITLVAFPEVQVAIDMLF